MLAVEDNRDVGDFATAALRERGCDRELATDGGAALAILGSDAARFNVVFSDVEMPGMSGLELGKSVRRHYPDLPSS